VVISVSRRVGQVTFSVSERTSCKNLKGLVAILFIRIVRMDRVIHAAANSFVRA
jgi:hypothetical protein